MKNVKRVLILGLDAMVPNMVEKFLAEGVLPDFAKLLKKGVFTRVRPVIPAQTPANWHTIATGATPGTHGIAVWGSHIPGEPVRVFHDREAFNAGLCRAEYLWETLARAGKKSVVMNYAGYPSTTDKATFIDWLFQPAHSYFDLAAPAVYHNCPGLNTTDPIELSPAQGWENLPFSKQSHRQTELPVVTTTEGRGPTYHALVYGRKNKYDSVLISSKKDASKSVAILAVGEWSDWITAMFHTADQGKAEGVFRFKLVELSPDGKRLRLYRSDAFPADGRFCSNKKLGKKLVAESGPFIHSAMTCSLHCTGHLDWRTVDELMEDEAKWWAKSAHIAMEETDSSLLVLHWHNLDSMGHSLVGKVDPAGTDYDPKKAEKYWDIIRNYYRAADRLVGGFMKLFDNGETVFAVISDHGMPANKKAVSLVNLFKKRGWIAITPDGKNVDWKKSRIFLNQNHLWINLKGRNQGGVVPSGAYKPLRSKVLSAMRDLKDRETGEHIFAFVLPREDAPMAGLWGDYIGDLVFCYNGGYRWSGPEVLRMGEERVIFPCGGSNHGPMIPTYETEVSSVMAALILSGPGVKRGAQLPKQEQAKICATDVAPTLAYLLGLEPPAQSEGRVLTEFLSDFHCKYPARTLKPAARPVRWRKNIKPKPITLKGDVTDEE